MLSFLKKLLSLQVIPVTPRNIREIEGIFPCFMWVFFPHLFALCF